MTRTMTAVTFALASMYATWTSGCERNPASSPATAGSSRDQVVAAARGALESSRVVEVYPTAAELPENLLKFHIHFSEPMARGYAREHVYLTDDRHTRIEGAFFAPVAELWDRDGRTLTMLLDPARVKTGLAVHEQVGRALVAGHSYHLVVEPGWRDRWGNPTEQRFERSFRVVPADRDAPRVGGWEIQAPRADTREPISVRFFESLDQACLAEFVRVVDRDGRIVPGDIRVYEGETVWRFVPSAPWHEREYRLVADSRLEDVAGNNLQEVFDHPAGQSRTVPVDERSVPFVPSGRSL